MGVQKLETNIPAGMTADEKELALVAELKAKHGVSQVHVLTAGRGQTIYVRMPATGVWRRFRAQMQEPRKRDEAGEALLRACLLHPEQAVLSEMIASEPGLLDSFATEVCEIAGLSKDIEKKVL